MDIKSLIPGSHIMYGIRGQTRRQILAALASPLVDEGVVTEMETFLDDLETREDQYTTQVASAVALPHARSNAVRRLGCTVGITDEPVTYNPVCELPCRVFFMIAVPAFAPTAHLPLLQHLAGFAHDAVRIEKLLTATSPAKAVQQIIRYKPQRELAVHRSSTA